MAIIFTIHIYFRCTAGVECWKAELIKTTNETIANAVEWVEQTPPQTPPIRTNVVEALIKALSMGEVNDNFSQSVS